MLFSHLNLVSSIAFIAFRAIEVELINNLEPEWRFNIGLINEEFETTMQPSVPH